MVAFKAIERDVPEDSGAEEYHFKPGHLTQQGFDLFDLGATVVTVLVGERLAKSVPL